MVLRTDRRAGEAVRTLHVGFVLEWFPPHIGGVEVLFDQLTRRLAEAGHRVTVVTTWLPGTPRKEVRNGVRIIRVRTPRSFQRYFFTVLAAPTALRALRDADIVHTTTYNAALPGWLVARLRRIPSVITVHEVWGPQWNRLSDLNRWAAYGFRLFEWLVLHLPFSRFICDSRFSEDRLRSMMRPSPDRTEVVYPAVDYNFWCRERHDPFPLRGHLSKPEDSFVYLYFGRPGLSKGVLDLLDAALVVREARPDSHLVLILARDPAGQYERIRQRIAALGLGDHVTMLDPVERTELPRYLLAANCICVPSLSEGFGYSAVEANALGCTVVATTGHSVEEVIPCGAMFVPPASPADLATAVLSVAAGRWTPPMPAQRYDIASHVEQVENIYREVIASPELERALEAS